MDEWMKKYQQLLTTVRERRELAKTVIADLEDAVSELTAFARSNPEFEECLLTKLESAPALMF